MSTIESVGFQDKVANGGKSRLTNRSPDGDYTIDLLGIVRRRFPIIVASALLGGAAGFAYYLLAPASFQSTSQILLMQNDSGAMVSNMKNAEQAISEDLLSTHMSLVQSSKILSKALQTEIPHEYRQQVLEGAQVSTVTSSDGDGKQVGPNEPASMQPKTESAQPNAEALPTDTGVAQPSTYSVHEEPPQTPPANKVHAEGIEQVSASQNPETQSDMTNESSADNHANTEQKSSDIVDDQLEIMTLGMLPSILEKLGEDETVVKFIQDRLYVTRGGQGRAKDARILSIGFRHSDPEEARLIVNAIVKEYTAYVQTKFKDINREAVDLIQKAREELQTDIEDRYEQYRKFRLNAPMLPGSASGTNVFATRYEELSNEISRLDLKIDEATGRLELVKDRLKELESTPDTLAIEKLALIDLDNAQRLGVLVTVERGEAQTAAFQALQPERMAGATAEYSSLLQLKAELRKSQKDLGEQHPKVLSLRAQIAEMEDFKSKKESLLGVSTEAPQLTPDDVMKAYIRLLQGDLDALIRNRKDVEVRLLEAEQQAKGLVEYELQNEEYSRGLSRQEDLFDSVVARLRDINMKQESSSLILEVIQDAELGEKVSPKLSIAGAIAVAMTLLLSGGGVLAAEFADKRVHSSEEIEEHLGTSVLSHIVDFDADTEARNSLKSRFKPGMSLAPSVLTWHRPACRASEAYRTVRAELIFRSSNQHTIIAVTSPNQGDGKSTTSVNLAVSLAKAGKSVLLLEADMRRPSISKLIEITAKTTLSDYLHGKCELDSSTTKVVDGLSVIAGGNCADNASELLSSPRFADLLINLKQQYDFVLVDCPPMLPVSDPAIVAPMVDGVILVVSSKQNSVNELKECRRILDAKNANVCGAVVNRVSSSPTSGYYYGGYTQNASYSSNT